MSRTTRPYLYLFGAIALVVVLSFPLESVGSYQMRIVLNAGIMMILAVSLNLINGFTGQFSLGHAGFMAVGAYTAAGITTLVLKGGTAGMPEDLVLLMSLIAGGITAAIAGLLIGIPSLRLKGDYLAIVTLGFGEIIRVILQNIPSLGGSLGISGIPTYTTFIWTFTILAILIFITEMLMRSTFGRGFLATRDDEIAAESVGVNTTKYKVIAFVIGAFFAGVAGGLYGHFNNLISPRDFGFLKSVEIVVMVILGGMGSTAGVLLAAALLTLLPELLRDVRLFGIAFSDFRMSIYSLFLILLMIYRPQGLLGDNDLRRLTGRFRKNRSTDKRKPAVT